jgi:hypothetical protein
MIQIMLLLFFTISISAMHHELPPEQESLVRRLVLQHLNENNKNSKDPALNSLKIGESTVMKERQDSAFIDINDKRYLVNLKYYTVIEYPIESGK